MSSKVLAGLAAVLLAGLVAWHFLRSPTSPGPAPAGTEFDVSQSRSTALPRRPAPRASAPVELTEEAPANQPSNILARLNLKEELPKLTLAQVDGYLRANHRSAESLIGAFYTTREKSLLAEAKEKFPNDPHVAFVAATQPGDSPEEHRKWLDAFKQSAPNNAMADYLSASEYFNAGRTDQALQEVQGAAGKTLQNYHGDFVLNNQEAYRAAGYSDVEARTIASMSLQLPELSNYKNVGLKLVDMAKAYHQAGDTASAQASLQLAMDVGQRVDGPGAVTLIQKLVGLSVQYNALRAMDPNGAIGSDNQTVQSRMNAIQDQRSHIKSLVSQFEAFKPALSDQDVMNFYDRWWHSGELQAFEWAVNKFGTPKRSQ